MNPKEIRFDPEAHRYFIGARELPGVTRIISDIYPTGNEHRYTENSRLIGEAVHRLVEYFLEGDLYEPGLPPWQVGYLDALKRFLDTSGFSPTHVEEIVGSEAYGFCGKLDLMGVWRGDSWLLDAKSGMRLPQHRLQTAGYKIGAAECGFGDVERRGALYLNSDGTYRLDPHEDPTDRSAFLAAATAVNWRWAHARN